MRMIKKLNKLPFSGKYEEIFFESGRGQNRTYVLFKTNSGEEWIGHFRTGENNLKDLKIADIPSQNIACIVSGGCGYIIEINKKIEIVNLQEDMIIDLAVDENTLSFYIATYWSILRVDENFNKINIELPINIDGIYFNKKIDRKLFLKLEEIGPEFKINYEYYIDLDKKMIEKTV